MKQVLRFTSCLLLAAAWMCGWWLLIAPTLPDAQPVRSTQVVQYLPLKGRGDSALPHLWSPLQMFLPSEVGFSRSLREEAGVQPPLEFEHVGPRFLARPDLVPQHGSALLPAEGMRPTDLGEVPVRLTPPRKGTVVRSRIETWPPNQIHNEQAVSAPLPDKPIEPPVKLHLELSDGQVQHVFVESGSATLTASALRRWCYRLKFSDPELSELKATIR